MATNNTRKNPHPAWPLRRRPLAVAVALALANAPAGAATLTVTDTCLLAEAMTAANSNTAVGGCPAGDDQDNGGDLIELTADVTLTAVDNVADGPNGLPSVSSTITLNGHGHTLARAEGAPAFRLLQVALEGRLTLNELTLQNGVVAGEGGEYFHGGGGLYNHGQAALTHSRVSGNSADYGAGIHNTGTLRLTETTLSNNRGFTGVGGLGNTGQATLINSTVSGNSGVEASGIENFSSGTLTLTHSTVADNRSWYGEAGLWNSGTLTVINSTLSGNETGLLAGGNTTLIHSTIANNGVEEADYSGGTGLLAVGNVTLTNSLIANNLGQDCRGTVTFEGVNFMGDGSCAALEAGQLSGDPRLGPLADNGGPTLTHALLAHSPARDQIPFLPELGCEPTEVLTDQRGVSRPQPAQGRCDIGAFEQLAPAPLHVEALLTFFDEAVAAGDLWGIGPGRSAPNRLHALRQQLAAAHELEAQEALTEVCGQLAAVHNRLHTDPNVSPRPDHFATGPAAAELAVMIEALRTEFDCP